MKSNRIAPDGTPRFAASHLGLFCLPMYHKKDARLIWVKSYHSIFFAVYLVLKVQQTLIFEVIASWIYTID